MPSEKLMRLVPGSAIKLNEEVPTFNEPCEQLGPAPTMVRPAGSVSVNATPVSVPLFGLTGVKRMNVVPNCGIDAASKLSVNCGAPFATTVIGAGDAGLPVPPLSDEIPLELLAYLVPNGASTARKMMYGIEHVKPGVSSVPGSNVMMLDPAAAADERFGAEWPEHPEVPIPTDVMFNGDKSTEKPPIPVRPVFGLGFVIVMYRVVRPPGDMVNG